MDTASSLLRSYQGINIGFAALLMATFTIDVARAAVDRTEANASRTSVVATASIEMKDGVEQITLDLSKAVGHVARKDGDELILWFDQPRKFDLSSLTDTTGKYLKGARLPAPGPSRWLVFDLTAGSDVIAERTQDHLLVITLGEEKVQADGTKLAKEQHQEIKKFAQQAPSVQPTTAPPKPTQIAPVERVDSRGLKTDKLVKTPPAIDDRDGERAGPRPLVPMARPAAVQAAKASPEIRSNAPQVREEALRRPAAVTSEAPAPVAQRASLPGQFQVDETALDRALERTLSREGAVLMPFGMIELEPSLSYTRRELDTPALINLFGFPGFGEANITRNDYTAALALRAGLPFDAQLEIDVPFTYVDQSEMVAIGFDPVNTVDDDAGAFGDLGIGLAKTVLKEGMWRPDVVARLRWDSQTGKGVENGIAFGGGTHELTGSLSLVKSQDPLAFFGSVAYEETFEEDDLDPGNRIGISIGTVLAASPETSLRAALRQDFIGDAEFQGETLEGTDQVAATLSLGASSVLGRGVLVDASVDVGLTGDAADYAARISFPVRFDARPVLSSIALGRSSSKALQDKQSAGDDG